MAHISDRMRPPLPEMGPKARHGGVWRPLKAALGGRGGPHPTRPDNASSSRDYHSGMTSRSYGQNCGLARSMDLLGERWTVLLLRELAMGPRRYRELATRLPGIGTNLLASRLRSLVDGGVIERVPLLPPASATAYALTAAGEELRPILGQLALWGMRHGRPFDDADETRPAWILLALFSSAGGRAVGRFGGVVQVTVGEDSMWGVAEDGTLQIRDGQTPASPALHVSTDVGTLSALVSGSTTLASATESGAVMIDGSPQGVQTFVELYDEEAGTA